MASLKLAVIISATLRFMANSVTPYNPQAGWSYYLEGRRQQVWPGCQYRFLSYPSDCSSIDMWNGAGVNQRFTFIRVSSDTFYLKTACGKYLSYPGDCNNPKVDTWPAAGINQEFRMIGGGELGAFILEAVGRAACSTKYVGFPDACSNRGPDQVTMLSGTGAAWNLHAASSPLRHERAAVEGCADPFAWHGKDGTFHLTCTGGNLGLFRATNLSTTFTHVGHLLGNPPHPELSHARWAPENIELDGGVNIAVYADSAGDPKGKHRVFWALSKAGPLPGKWSTYSSTSLNLGNAEGGEIDAHVFTDLDGQHYLVWKTDDNNVGAKTTRIWAQRVEANVDAGLVLKDTKKMIMDSAGLWWVTSWVAGGSLVEGPEIVRKGDYYYLFFAAGRYCKASYSEGVARSSSVFGPYEKLGVPVLSTTMVGQGDNGKTIGPGHASYLTDKEGAWHAVWHASEGENCNRHPYVNALGWSADGWPYVDFAVPTAAPPPHSSTTPPMWKDGRVTMGNGTSVDTKAIIV